MGGRCREGASVCVNSSCWFRTGSSDSTAPRPVGRREGRICSRPAHDVGDPVGSVGDPVGDRPASGTGGPLPAPSGARSGARRGHPVGPRRARRPRPGCRPAPSGARRRAPPGSARRSGAATGPARAGVGPRRAGDLSDRRAASGAPSGGVGRSVRVPYSSYFAGDETPARQLSRRALEAIVLLCKCNQLHFLLSSNS